VYIKVFSVILTVLLVTTHLQAAEPDYHLFVSKIHKFTVQYPRSWNRADVVHQQTVIRVESPDGDDFNTTVVQDQAFLSLSPSEYSKIMYNQVDTLVSNIMSKNYPDAKLVKKEISTLSQQPAILYEMDYTLSAAGRDIAMRSYVISTKHKDKQYTLTFRTPRQFFPVYRPVIELITLSFQLTKTSIE